MSNNFGWETKTEPFQAKLYKCPRCQGYCKDYGWKYKTAPSFKWANLPDCPICEAKGYLTGLIVTEMPKEEK